MTLDSIPTGAWDGEIKLFLQDEQQVGNNQNNNQQQSYQQPQQPQQQQQQQSYQQEYRNQNGQLTDVNGNVLPNQN